MNNYNNGNFYTPRQNPLDGLKSFFKSNNMLVKLIIINVAVWLIIRFIDVMFDLFNTHITEDLLSWLAVPASMGKLITRPWTLVTYMFLHFDFLHILFNMLWLYWFGRIFLEYLSERQLLSIYLFGGLAGALFYILSFNIFPKFQDAYLMSMALGASASVVAIVVAISYYVPNYRIHLLFFGPVKIIYIALFSIGLDILMIKSSNSGGHLAHLGGAMWGFFYIYMLKKGSDLSYWVKGISFKRFNAYFFRPKKTKFRNVYTNNSSRPKTDEDYNLEKMKRQERIDEILDKISKSGYESLSKEEKELLFKTSNKKSN
ncbi:MAG: rhomboid family intramembrane serine protease [Bacteroidales bacterium]|nr:rhomboid family intramembrane serine protease [Bacteroidales bacterium]